MPDRCSYLPGRIAAAIGAVLLMQECMKVTNLEYEPPTVATVPFGPADLRR